MIQGAEVVGCVILQSLDEPRIAIEGFHRKIINEDRNHPGPRGFQECGRVWSCRLMNFRIFNIFRSFLIRNAGFLRECLYLPWFPDLVNFENALLQAGNGISLLIVDGGINHHHVHRQSEGELAPVFSGFPVLRCKKRPGKQQKQREDFDSPWHGSFATRSYVGFWMPSPPLALKYS